MPQKLVALYNTLKKSDTLLAGKKATAGFDGFVDTIVKIIRNKDEKKMPTFFNNIPDFGNYIISKKGTSFSLELEEISTRLGGNMPIMSNALACLGVKINCIGAFGYPQIHPVFNGLDPGCYIYSFENPGTSTAFEFYDGKIFLAQMGTLNISGWEKIKSTIGLETIIDLYKDADLLCILNWSEIDASTGIWKGILKDVLPEYSINSKKQIAFFDLSDCSKRSDESIMEALNLLKEFSFYSKVILGLNKNEARRICEVLCKKDLNENFEHSGEMIFQKLNIEILLLHSSKEAMAFSDEGKFNSHSFFTNNPAISTGAGDNFNAGFCAAQLLQLDPDASLIFANAVAGSYIRMGKSPQLKDVIGFLEERKEDLK